MRRWLTERVGVVRARQLLEEARHRLAFVPLAMTALAVALSQLTLLVDRAIGNRALPGALVTTVDSARAVMATIAGGLITAFTLLVSMMLVAVQLASRQFSPRTLRNWLGDPTLRRAVGLVMATTVYCLLGLRSARDLADDTIVPHVTVIVAVLLGVASLVAAVRAVDHVTTNLQIGTVAQRITDETIGAIETVGGSRLGEHPRVAPAARLRPAGDETPPPPATAIVVESERSGWVQQIDAEALAHSLPHGSVAWIEVVHGGFVAERSPLARVAPGPEDRESTSEDLAERVRASIALGGSRTMQRDIGFGISQLADIAVRALSPGVNDPQTAQDIIRHLGEVLLAVWSYEEHPSRTEEDGRTIHEITTPHAEYLRAAYDPIRRYGRADPAVMRTLVRTVAEIRDEVERRDLPGPPDPLADLIAELADAHDDAEWLERERRELAALIARAARRTPPVTTSSPVGTDAEPTSQQHDTERRDPSTDVHLT